MSRVLSTEQAKTAIQQIHVAGRRVRLNGELWLDSARRLKEGDTVELAEQSAPKPRTHHSIRIRHVDTHVVVVEKPPGCHTVRHPTNGIGPHHTPKLNPTLEDLVTSGDR